MELFIKTKYFNPGLTLTGGQAFRWDKLETGRYHGVVGNRAVELRCGKDGIRLLGVSDKDRDFWGNYFDAGTDYEEIVRRFSEDAVLAEACKFAHGLRLLRQEPFETLISFIISQNNNIPRITGIIGRLCKGGAFPPAEVLAGADLSAIGAGYRARYITDAAQRVNDGEINLEAIRKMPTDIARHELMKITGVGEKVADCVLLFAYRKNDAFPRDVHIKRALEKYYPGGLPDCIKGYEGIAQQYLFEYIRNNQK
jgi:N-glycosylase/DNA lyase